jgi:voltage-gated potassium channel
MLIEGWSFMDGLYMTIITVATVGFGEVQQISPAGRIFTISLIFLGVGFFMYVAGYIITFLVEGQIRTVLGRRKLEKQISRLKNHYIVCGYGRIGRVLCRYLTQRYLDVVAIEKDPERITIMNEDGVLYVNGEATDEENLVRAGIDRAKGMLAVLGTDADNVFLVLMARQFQPDIFIVARAIINATKKTLLAAGANKVISPYDLGARRMAHAILRPTVIRFLELAFADENTDINVEEILVKETSKLVGTKLADSGIRKNLNLIILAKRKADGTMRFNPGADTIIRSGDILVVVGENRSLLQLSRILSR